MPRVFNGGLAHERILNQAERHANCCDAKTPVETLPAPQGGGKQRTNECANIDAHIEDGEATIAARVIATIHGTKHNLCGGLNTAGADGDKNEANGQTSYCGNKRQSNVTKHHHAGRVKQCAFCTQDSVSNKRSQQAGHVDQAAVGTHNRRRVRPVQAKATIGSGVIHVQQDKGLHAIEAKALPHFHAKKVGQTPRVPKKCTFAALRRGRSGLSRRVGCVFLHKNI